MLIWYKLGVFICEVRIEIGLVLICWRFGVGVGDAVVVVGSKPPVLADEWRMGIEESENRERDSWEMMKIKEK